MNFISLAMLLLCCLPPFGFAMRGIALLRLREVKPGRVISASGVVAMISVWLLAGFTPYAASEFAKVYREFELDLPRLTELVISLSYMTFRYGLLWYPFALALSLCALTVPEILFYGKKP
jgi:hypothetical protein